MEKSTMPFGARIPPKLSALQHRTAGIVAAFELKLAEVI